MGEDLLNFRCNPNKRYCFKILKNDGRESEERGAGETSTGLESMLDRE